VEAGEYTMGSPNAERLAGLSEAEERLVGVMDGVMDAMRALEKVKVYDHHEQLIQILISLSDEIDFLRSRKTTKKYPGA
jgi:hypothetical protein